MDTLLTQPTTPVYQIAIAPDGERFAYCDQRKAHVFQSSDGLALHALSIASKANPVNALTFSPDGSKLLAGQKTGVVFDVESGKRAHSLKGHRREMSGALFVDADVVLTYGGRAIGPTDHSLRQWRLDDEQPTGEVLFKMDNEIASVTAGERMIRAIDRRGAIHEYDPGAKTSAVRTLAGLGPTQVLRVQALSTTFFAYAKGVDLVVHAFDGGEDQVIPLAELETLVSEAIQRHWNGDDTEANRTTSRDYLRANPYAHVLRFDPSDPSILFASTDEGLARIDLNTASLTRHALGLVGAFAVSADGSFALISAEGGIHRIELRAS